MFGGLSGHDAYELLHVSPDASSEEIQRAWRKLARTHHPDRFTDPAAKTRAERESRLINLARDVLLNQRATYDAHRRGPEPAEELIEEPWEEFPDPWDEEPPPDPWADATPGAAAPPFTYAPRPQPPPAYTQPTYTPPAYPPPTYPPPQYVPLPQSRYRRRRRMGATAGAGCALFYFGMIFLFIAASFLGGSDDPEPEAPVPGRLAGTWTGTVKMVGGDSSWDIELTLRKGKHNGKVRYLRGKCTGTAVPVAADASRTVTVRTAFSNEGSSCDAGDLRISSRADGRAQATYYKADGVTKSATGTLRRR
ncbi:J domain-containing protein [Actinomadura terrae]|uniref:J domain-containing protein n=1 Tax=Actinomadura terrae TaxID=604353 RepID=UPI001FA80FE4|nr:J domain-containing protein [Actinomadura terrae]